MKRIALALTVLSLAAYANEDAHAGHGDDHGGHEEKHDAPSFILHHVADSEEFQLEIPFPPYELPALHVADWFGDAFIFGNKEACGGHASAAFAAFPSLEKWIHGCYDLRPTKSVLMLWLGSALLFVALFFGRKRNQNGVPQGTLAHSIEAIALFIRDEIAAPNIGKEESKRYLPFLFSLFFFILAVNWLSLIPGFFAGTSVLMVTAALAIITFILVQLAGIRSAGLGGYLAHLTGGVPPVLWIIMIPVEILGLFTKPFALLVRLFANMLAGHMVIFFLLALIFMWTPYAAALSVPMTVAIYCLEIFVGILQAYIFTLLTCLFIGQGVQMGHHGHDDAHGHGEAAHH